VARLVAKRVKGEKEGMIVTIVMIAVMTGEVVVAVTAGAVAEEGTKRKFPVTGSRFSGIKNRKIITGNRQRVTGNK
jgi:hypothetical protein